LNRLFLRSLRVLALWIVILRLGMWVAMVMFHIVITVDIIRGIPWSIGGRFWIYPSKGVLERFAPVFGAAREVALVKNGVGSGEHCIGGAHKQEVALIARGNTNISHKLRLGSHLVCSSRGWEIYKCSTAKHTEVVDVRHLPLKHFMGGAPSEASYRSAVVNVGCVSERKFPPGVRNTGLMPHRLCFIHESAP